MVAPRRFGKDYPELYRPRFPLEYYQGPAPVPFPMNPIEVKQPEQEEEETKKSVDSIFQEEIEMWSIIQKTDTRGLHHLEQAIRKPSNNSIWGWDWETVETMYQDELRKKESKIRMKHQFPRKTINKSSWKAAAEILKQSLLEAPVAYGALVAVSEAELMQNELEIWMKHQFAEHYFFHLKPRKIVITPIARIQFFPPPILKGGRVSKFMEFKYGLPWICPPIRL